jgi:hypothetical protein
MYIQVTCSIFHDQFQRTRPENFTYAGLNALYDFLTDMGEDHDCELDVIAICCDFSQYGSIEAALEEYQLEDREELEDNTLVIECDDGTVIIQNF